MVIAKVTFSKVDEIFSEGKQEPEPMAREKSKCCLKID